MATPDFLTIQDLYNLVGARRVNGYFDDTFNGEIGDATENEAVNLVLCTAEGIFYSQAMKNYSGNPRDPGSSIRLMILNDPMLRLMTSWLALQMAAERKTEFTDADGHGPFKAQYARAMDFLKEWSKGLVRSAGEAHGGLGANTGGNFTPDDVLEADQRSPFVFAGSKNFPTGHGGF